MSCNGIKHISDPTQSTTLHELFETTRKPSGHDASSSNESPARIRSRPDHGKVLLVCVSIGATFMVVLGMLYFANHHWSSIQAKLSGVPYLRQEQQADSRVNPQYDTTEDNVNLIWNSSRLYLCSYYENTA